MSAPGDEAGRPTTVDVAESETPPDGGFAGAVERTAEAEAAPLAVAAPAENAAGAEPASGTKSKLSSDAGLTDIEFSVLLSTTCEGAPRAIAAWFMLFCKHRRLDPFSRQVYLWNDKTDKTGKWNVVTGIDGLRVIASRSPYYRGQLKPVWTFASDPTQADGILRFSKGESQYGKIAGKRRPEDCEIVVRRAIPQAPTDSTLYLEFYGIARFDEFVKTNASDKIFGNWEVQPEHQLRIRAEAMALRMGFPEEVGGIYLEEELRDRADMTAALGPVAGGDAGVAQAVNSDVNETDVEIDRMRRELGWTAAKLRIEGDKHGGGKAGLLELLSAATKARDERGPKGGTRGAAAAEDAKFVEVPKPDVCEHGGTLELVTPPGGADGVLTRVRRPEDGLGFEATGCSCPPRDATPTGAAAPEPALPGKPRSCERCGHAEPAETEPTEIVEARCVDVPACMARWEAARAAEKLAGGEQPLLLTGSPIVDAVKGDVKIRKKWCKACLRKKGELHADGCPREETDDTPEELRPQP